MCIRDRYKAKWTRVASRVLNGNTKRQVKYYEEKYNQGKNSDNMLKSCIESSKTLYGFFTLDRNAIIEQASSDMSQSSSTAANLRECLSELTKLGKEADELLKVMVQTLETEEVTNQMDGILKRVLDKRQVFEQLRDKYVEKTRQLESNIAQRKSLLSQVELLMEDYRRTGFESDEKWSEFLNSLSVACDSFVAYFNNLESGYSFHTQISEYIKKAVTSVNDFIMSRNLERDDLLGQIAYKPSAPQPGYSAYGNPPVPPPYPGYAPQYPPCPGQGYPQYRPRFS
eukprot:TRINITY_DN12695_c0_g1_i13.p1 TRINITY_DN12695_c0_g1~~TRINITY_DN12695_c0_g1_i13.p1  ORF type:complete len:299 (-),score=82.27 TRINITY_DN12695_c0_g1_i13:114-965(-)